jgi:hypothetical protein
MPLDSGTGAEPFATCPGCVRSGAWGPAGTTGPR